MNKYHYTGDVNLTHGGTFYETGNFALDYADAVVITPASNMGGPDNQFLIERATVHGLDDSEKCSAALAYCDAQTLYDSAAEEDKRKILVEACIAYGMLDYDSTECVQIGVDDPFFDGGKGWQAWEIDTHLRGNAKLENYVKREYLR